MHPMMIDSKLYSMIDSMRFNNDVFKDVLASAAKRSANQKKPKIFKKYISKMNL